MKKFFIFLFVSLLALIPSQVFAAPLEIHGDVTKSLSLEDFNENSNVLGTILSGKYSLELSLTGDNGHTLRAGFKNIGNDLNLNYTRNQSFYVDLDFSAFSIWFAMGLNDDYPVVSLGDPMDAGNLASNFKISDAQWTNEYTLELLYWYDYYNESALTPKFQIGSELNLGKVNLKAYYGQYYIPFFPYFLFPLSNPLSVSTFNDSRIYPDIDMNNLLGILMIRGTVAFNDYFNLGLSFINYNLSSNCCYEDIHSHSQLILDVTGNTPYIGGNYTLAMLGTFLNSYECIICDDSNVLEDGLAFYAALNDIPIGEKHQFHLGLDFAFAQDYSCFCHHMCDIFTNYEALKSYSLSAAVTNTNFLYDSIRFGANLSTTVDLEEFGYVDLTLRDYITVDPSGTANFGEEGITNNILSLEADLYTPKGSHANLTTAFTSRNISDKSLQTSELFIGFKGDVVVNDFFTINGRFFLQDILGDFEYPYYNAEIGVTGKWDLPVNEHVASADYTIGAMIGASRLQYTSTYLPFKALVYMELNSRFTNDLELNMAGYVDSNFEIMHTLYNTYINPSLSGNVPVTFVATATAKYWFTSKLALSATATYRNWETDESVDYLENPSGIIGNNLISPHYFEIKDNFFTSVALTYFIDDNSSVQLAWGKTGLADAEVSDPAKYPNATVYPWMKLSTAPRYGVMDWKALKLAISFKF